jgi:hypothetical protein
MATPDPFLLMRGELRGDLPYLRARDVLDEVEPVDAEIHQRVGRAGGSRREQPHVFVRRQHVLRQVAAADAAQRTECAFGDLATKYLHQRVATICIGNCPDATGLRRGFHHLLAFGGAGRHWFFAEHVRAGLERGDAMRGMQMIRGTDVHNVGSLVVKQPCDVVVSARSAERLRGLQRSAADADQFAT